MQYSCADCKTSFTLTDGERKFFQDKGFPLPKRCVDCRKKRKQEREV